CRRDRPHLGGHAEERIRESRNGEEPTKHQSDQPGVAIYESPPERPRSAHLIPWEALPVHIHPSVASTIPTVRQPTTPSWFWAAESKPTILMAAQHSGNQDRSWMLVRSDTEAYSR